MLVKEWFNYLATYLLSSSVCSKDAAIKGDASGICPCFKTTKDGEVAANDENLRILIMHSSNGNISQYLDMPNRRSISPQQTNFTLYTRNDVNGSRIYSDDLTSLLGKYNPKKPTVIAAHGFQSNERTTWMKQLKNAQLKAVDCNFISIDWSLCAKTCCYFGARDCAIVVGGYLEKLLRTMVELGADPQTIHLMGHSLGAHLVAQASRNGLNVARISGFDPPRWGFDEEHTNHRLDADDAQFVDVIHTTSTLGWNYMLGHADFFPNGADHQPGCAVLNEFCSHSASYYYYIQSLKNSHKYPAYKCKNVESALRQRCNGSNSYMGIESYKGQPGVYYIKVTQSPSDNI